MVQKEVDEMIWEVDEGLDGAVDWEEFKLMFEVRHMTQASMGICWFHEVEVRSERERDAY